MFQRNLFDVAVSICQHHGLGQNGLSDVYKRWADFLYAKGEHMEAAQKYIQVIFGIFLNEFRGDSQFHKVPIESILASFWGISVQSFKYLILYLIIR